MIFFFQLQIIYCIISKNVWPTVFCNTIICKWEEKSAHPIQQTQPSSTVSYHNPVIRLN